MQNRTGSGPGRFAGLPFLRRLPDDFGIPREGIHARFARGVSWNLVSAVSTQGSVFLANVVIANILGKLGFGEFGMIQNTVLFFAGLGQMATGVTATKYVAECRSRDPDRAGRILGLCSSVSFALAFAAAAITVLIASWLASAVLKAPHLTTGLLLSSGIIFFSILTGFQTGALAGLEGFGRLGRAAMAQSAFHLAACGLCAYFWKLEGALAGLAISLGMRWFLFGRALTRECADQNIRADRRAWWRERSVLTGFAVPSAAIGLFTMPAVWLANVFLVRQPDGYAQLGLFSAAYSLRTMILFLPGLMNNVGMSLLNHQIGDDDAGNYRKVFRTNLILTQSVGVAGGLAVILSGPWLLRAFGKEFTEGYTVLLILVLSALVETYSAAMYQAIQSQGKMWLSFLSINTPWWIVFMASAYFFIPGGLAAGLAWAYAAAWFVHAAMTTLQVRRLGLWRSPHGLP